MRSGRPRLGFRLGRAARRRSAAAAARRGSAGTGRASAFTILELLLVLAAVTVVSTLAIHAWFARPEVTLANAAKLLAEELRTAQAHATLRHGEVEFLVDPDGGGYGVHDVGAPEEVGPPFVRRFATDAVFEDVRVAAVKLSLGQRLVFDALGRPSCHAAITLRHRGVTQTVLVDASNARVTLEGEP